MAMPTEVAIWVLPVIGSVCGLLGYLVAHFRLSGDAKRLIADKTEIALELDSIKVTSGQLELSLQNLELVHRSKNQFYLSTSHDLRQPLHALSMFCAVLQKRDLDDATKDIVGDISEAVFDVTREIDLLLNIARVDVESLKLNPVEVDLNVETRRIAHQYQRVAKMKGLDLEVHTFTNDVVSLDRALFDRLLRNLIDNAIKFTDDGYVRVTITYANGEPLCLSVIDSGIGISKEDQEGIYREFYQGRNLESHHLCGVGLGLASVFKLISRVGGEINVASTGVRGTSVTLEIPNVQWVEKVTELPHHVAEKNPNELAQKTVLLLENDTLVGRSTILLLESAGYSVASAASLSEAHGIQRTQKVDAACLEISANEEAARKLVDALRAAEPTMPIVLMTSDKTKALRVFGTDVVVLSKPASSKKLLANLEIRVETLK